MDVMDMRSNTIADSDALIEKWLAPDPYRGGAAEVRLRKYGVHVWALIGHLQGVDGDLAQVAKDYDVPLEAVRAAVAYYGRHSAVIDDRLAANLA
jgi:uncharacterized protein (DUF433 family)